MNADSPLVKKAQEAEGGLNADNQLLRQLCDLALLSAGMLKGKPLADFIRRSAELLK